MASNVDDLDLDFNDDFGDGFDDISLEIENPENDRNPIAEAKDAAVDAVITKVTDRDTVKDAIKEAMPNQYRSTVEFGEQQLRTLEKAKNGLMEPIRKELPQFKRNLNRLTPVVERYFGKGIAGKFAQITDARKESPDVDQNAEEIRNGLESAFGSWSEKQEAFQTRQLTQEMLASQTDESRFNAQYELLASIELNTRKQLAFNTDVTAQVMRQNLELNYKKYHLLKGLLKVNTESFGLAVTELRNITKNTGLPDLVKQRNSETFKQLFLEEWQGRTVESAVDFGRNYFSKWGENITNRMKEIGGEIADTMSQVGDAAGMYADIQEEMAEMGGGQEQSLTSTVATTAGGMVGKTGIDQAIKAGQKRLNTFLKENPKARRLGKELALFNETRIGSVNDYISETNDNGGVLSGLLNWLQELAPTLETDRENVRNNLIDRITDKAEWDTLQRETLVNIIPNWLSKIHQAVKEIVLGEGNVEREVFDLYTERFITEREATESMLQNLVKDSERKELNERVDEVTDSLFEGFDEQKANLSDEAKRVFKDALVEQARNSPELDINKLLSGQFYNTDDKVVTKELNDTLRLILNDNKEENLKVKELGDDALDKRVDLVKGFKSVGSSGAIEELQKRLNAIDRGGNLDLLRQAGLLDKEGQIVHSELNALLHETGIAPGSTPTPPPSNNTPPNSPTPPTDGGGVNNTASNKYTTNVRNINGGNYTGDSNVQSVISDSVSYYSDTSSSKSEAANSSEFNYTQNINKGSYSKSVNLTDSVNDSIYNTSTNNTNYYSEKSDNASSYVLSSAGDVSQDSINSSSKNTYNVKGDSVNYYSDVSSNDSVHGVYKNKDILNYQTSYNAESSNDNLFNNVNYNSLDNDTFGVTNTYNKESSNDVNYDQSNFESNDVNYNLPFSASMEVDAPSDDFKQVDDSTKKTFIELDVGGKTFTLPTFTLNPGVTFNAKTFKDLTSNKLSTTLFYKDINSTASTTTQLNRDLVNSTATNNDVDYNSVDDDLFINNGVEYNSESSNDINYNSVNSAVSNNNTYSKKPLSSAVNHNTENNPSHVTNSGTANADTYQYRYGGDFITNVPDAVNDPIVEKPVAGKNVTNLSEVNLNRYSPSSQRTDVSNEVVSYKNAANWNVGYNDQYSMVANGDVFNLGYTGDVVSYDQGYTDYYNNEVTSNTSATFNTRDLISELKSVGTSLGDKLSKITNILEVNFQKKEAEKEEPLYNKPIEVTTTQPTDKDGEDPIQKRLDTIITHLDTIEESTLLTTDSSGSSTGLLEDIRSLVSAIATGKVVDGVGLMEALKNRTKAIFSSPFNAALKVKRRAGKMLSGGMERLRGLKDAIVSRVSKPLKFVKRKASEALGRFSDIYVEGDTSPVLLGKDIQRGIYYNYVDGKPDGKSIRNIDDIKGPIFNTDTQTVVVSQEDYDKGLYVRRDGIFKPIKSLATTIATAPLKIARRGLELGGTAFNRTKEFISETYNTIKEKTNTFVDVYNKEGRLVMSAEDLRNGKYYTMEEGSPVPIKSFKDLLSVRSSIYETVDGVPTVVVNVDELKEGLRSFSGKKLKMRGLGAALGNVAVKGGKLMSSLVKAPLDILRAGGKMLKGMLDGTLARAAFINLPDDIVFKTQNVYIYTDNDPVYGDSSDDELKSPWWKRKGKSEEDAEDDSDEDSKSFKDKVKEKTDKFSDSFTERATAILAKVKGKSDKDEDDESKPSIKDKIATKIDKAKARLSKDNLKEDKENIKSRLKGSELGKKVDESDTVKSIKEYFTKRDESTMSRFEKTTQSITKWFDERKKSLTKKVKGDTDGDGIREGSWRDRLKKMKDRVKPKKKEKKKETKTESYLSKIALILTGISTVLGTGFKSLLKIIPGGGKLVSTIGKGITAAAGWVGAKLGIGGATTAATTPAKKSAIKAGLKTAGKFAGKRLLTAGAGLAVGAVAAAPFVTAAVTIASVVWGAWEIGSAIYGYFDRRRDSDLYEFARHMQYGYYTGNDGAYEDNKVRLRYFEKEMLDKVTTNDKGAGDILMTPQAIWEEYAGDLGGNSDDANEARQFATWYKARFKPVLFKWVAVMSAFKNADAGWFGSDNLNFSNLQEGLAEENKESFFKQVMDYKPLEWDPLMITDGASYEMPIQAKRREIQAYIDKYILKLSEVEMEARAKAREPKSNKLDDKVVLYKPTNKGEPDKKELLVARALGDKPVTKAESTPPTPKGEGNATDAVITVNPKTPEVKDNKVALINEKLATLPVVGDKGRVLPDISEREAANDWGRDTYYQTIYNENPLGKDTPNYVMDDSKGSASKRILGEEWIAELDPLNDVESRIAIYDDLIKAAAKRYDVDEQLIRSVIRDGSYGYPSTVINDDKAGLMPLSIDDAIALGVKDRFDPASSIWGGTRHLKRQLTAFDNDRKQALAAYWESPKMVNDARKSVGTSESSPVMEKLYEDNVGMKERMGNMGLSVDSQPTEPNHVKPISFEGMVERRTQRTKPVVERVKSPSKIKLEDTSYSINQHREEQVKQSSEEIITTARELLAVNRLQLDELKTLNANVVGIKETTQSLDNRESDKLDAQTELKKETERQALRKRPRQEQGTRTLQATPVVSVARRYS